MIERAPEGRKGINRHRKVRSGRGIGIEEETISLSPSLSKRSIL
jgi:hypothetical protein